MTARRGPGGETAGSDDAARRGPGSDRPTPGSGRARAAGGSDRARAAGGSDRARAAGGSDRARAAGGGGPRARGPDEQGPDADPCARWRELASARLDGELEPDGAAGGAAGLDAHLAGCAPCRAALAGLERVRGALRGGLARGLGLVALDATALAARLRDLDRRLAEAPAASEPAGADDAPLDLVPRADDAPLALAPGADDAPLALAPGTDPTDAPAPAPPPWLARTPLEPRPPGPGPLARAAGVALALAFVAGAAWLLAERARGLLDRHGQRPADVAPRPGDPPRAPDGGPEPGAATTPPDTPAPGGPTPDVRPPEAPPEPAQGLAPDPAEGPHEGPARPGEGPGEVGPDAPPGQVVAQGGTTTPRTGPGEAGPPSPGGGVVSPPGPGPATPDPVALDLAALERLVALIQDRSTPAAQRPSMIASVGDARFDAPPAYRFLAFVLEGGLDGLEAPNESRWAACEALGRLGGEPAAAVLLAAAVRPAFLDEDGAALVAALARLREDAAVARVGDALLDPRAGDERRFLLVRALAALGRPAGQDALGQVVHAGRADPALRRAAALALGACGDERAVDPLARALDGRRLPSTVRQGAAGGLGALAARLGPAPALACVARLDEAAGDADPALARAAVRGLGEAVGGTGAPGAAASDEAPRAAVSRLLARLDPAREPREGVRAAAREALVLATGQTFAAPEAWRRWWEGNPPLAPGGTVALAEDDLAYFRLPGQADRVVFVLDQSGSMGAGGKWELAVFELVRALEALPPRVRFDVVTFADGPKAAFGGLAPATAQNVRRAVAFVRAQQVVVSAQTAILPALRTALGREGVEAVYFVTDGLDSRLDDRALRLAVARENRRPAARIHTVLIRRGGTPVAVDRAPERPDDPPETRFMRGVARDAGGVFARN